MIDMASRQIIPAVVGYTQKLAKTVLDVKAAGVEPSVQTELLAQVNEKLTEMKGALADLQKIEAEASAMEDGLILINAGPNILRFVPPLVITAGEVDEMAKILDRCLAKEA